jgi:CelD/BcsL family acetyltransferase involved in cellulose biosynthesis
MLGMLGKEPGDYWDVVAAPADRAAVSAAVAEELVHRRGEWDAGILSCLVPDSATADVLAGAGAGLRIMHRSAVACPAIVLPSTWDAYLAMLPRGRRGNLRRHLRRLDEGEVKFREVRDPGELPRALARRQELRQLQWDERGRSLNPVHRTDRFRAFLFKAVQALVPVGQARVWEFRFAGQTAGIYVNFVDSRSFYWHLGGFDPAHAAVGIGKIAIATGMRQSIEKGRARYDFTRGPEPHKTGTAPPTDKPRRSWWGVRGRARGPPSSARAARTRAERARPLGALRTVSAESISAEPMLAADRLVGRPAARPQAGSHGGQWHPHASAAGDESASPREVHDAPHHG